MNSDNDMEKEEEEEEEEWYFNQNTTYDKLGNGKIIWQTSYDSKEFIEEKNRRFSYLNFVQISF